MSEAEQLVAEALRALEHAPGLSWAEKAAIAGRIEDLAYRATALFLDREEAEFDAKWSKSA